MYFLRTCGRHMKGWNIYRIMHELPWITIFLVKSEVICNWQSLANHITSDQKIVIHGNECIILFLTRYFMFWTHNCAKNNHRPLIFAIVAKNSLFCVSIVTSSQLISDVTRTSIVTSHSLTVLAHANWSKGDLHYWITTMNIDFAPPAIHGLACKKFKCWAININ